MHANRHTPQNNFLKWKKPDKIQILCNFIYKNSRKCKLNYNNGKKISGCLGTTEWGWQGRGRSRRKGRDMKHFLEWWMCSLTDCCDSFTSLYICEKLIKIEPSYIYIWIYTCQLDFNEVITKMNYLSFLVTILVFYF